MTRRLMPHLTGHTFVHIRDTPLRGMKDTPLLPIVEPDFDVFLTTDANLRFQQNLKRFDLVFVIMRPRSNNVRDLVPLVPATLAVLDALDINPYHPGGFYEIFP